jgi:hypothetical protein
MSDLKELDIERLSRLFASGNMMHAREIARLLKQARQAPQPKPDLVVAILRRFLKASSPAMLISPEA